MLPPSRSATVSPMVALLIHINRATVSSFIAHPEPVLLESDPCGMRAKEATPKLVQMREHPDKRVRRRAEKALQFLGSES